MTTLLLLLLALITGQPTIPADVHAARLYFDALQSPALGQLHDCDYANDYLTWFRDEDNRRVAHEIGQAVCYDGAVTYTEIRDLISRNNNNPFNTIPRRNLTFGHKSYQI